MSTHMIHQPFVARQPMQATRSPSDFWQRMLRSFLAVCEDIGRDRARRELHLLAMQWDGTRPELARQARLAAANCARPSRD